MRRAGPALGLGAALALPWLLPPFYLLFAGELLIWALFALSFNVLYGGLGLLSLGQSAFFGLGAYAVALSLLALTPNPLLALGLALVVSAAAAAAFGALAIRTRSHGFIILTAVGAMALYLLTLNRSSLTGGDNGRTFSVPPLGGLDLTDPTLSYALGLSWLVGVLALLAWLQRTPLGLAWALVRENERRAAELGYAVPRLKWVAFVLAGTLAGLAGGLYALFNRFVSASLFHWILAADVIVWTLFGGAGTLLGPVLGTVVFKGLELLLSRWWAVGHPLLLGLALILVVRLFPAGLTGTRHSGPRR